MEVNFNITLTLDELNLVSKALYNLDTKDCTKEEVFLRQSIFRTLRDYSPIADIAFEDIKKEINKVFNPKV
jgi:hypothetical protein